MFDRHPARAASARRAGGRSASHGLATIAALESRRLLAASFIADVTPTGGDNFVADPTVVGGNVFFIQDSTTQAARLWKTDGTAAGTVMLKDPYPANTNNEMKGLTPVGDKLLFFTRDATGPGLWKSDGTAAGTVLVKRLVADSGPSFVLGDRLYFFLTDANQRTQLWRSDGTATGTVLAWSAPSTALGAVMVAPSPDGRTALFTLTGTNDYYRAPLWVTDGTSAGTHIAASPPAGTQDWRPRDAVYAGGRAFFPIDDRGTLWSANADGSGAAPVTTALGQPVTGVHDLAPFGNRVLFTGLIGNQGGAMASDGTPAGTVMLASPPGGFGPYFPATDTTAYFFVGGQDPTNRGIWVTDGTVQGTRRAVDLTSGSAGFTYGGKVYFTHSTEWTGEELWESDGTLAGTRLVQDIRLGLPGSYPGYFATLGDHVILKVTNGNAKSELWNLDPSVPTGTLAGTAFMDISRNGKRDGYESYAIVTAYLDLNDNARRDPDEPSHTTFNTGRFEFPGLPAGRWVLRFEPAANPSTPATVPAGGNYVINLQPGEQYLDLNLGVDPGVAAVYGTVFNDANGNGQRDPDEAAPGQQRLYLDLNRNGAFDATEPAVLTFPDGSYVFTGAAVPGAGTYTVRRVPANGWRQTAPSPWGGATVTLAAANAVAEAPAIGITRADGGVVSGLVFNDWNQNGVSDRFDTRRPNALVYADLNGNGTHDADAEPVALTDANGSYTFPDLPRGDTTLRMRLDYNPQHPESPLQQIAPPPGAGRTVTVPATGQQATVPGFYVFDAPALPPAPAAPTALRGTPGRIFDGRFAVTLNFRDNANNELFNAIERRHELSSGGSGQWERIGEAENANPYFVDLDVMAGHRYTYRVVAVNSGGESAPSDEATVLVVPGFGTPVKDINPTGASDPDGMTAFNHALYFSADDGTNGRELWRSDGTAAGTALLKDVNPGAENSNPGQLTVVGDTLFFVAFDPDHGAELWKTDGTPAGTVLVKDLDPGPGSLQPANLMAVGNTLYFVAAGGVNNGSLNLWKSDGTPEGTVRVSTASVVGGYQDLYPGAFLAAVGDTVFFRGGDSAAGAELWKSDGTDAGTVLVKDLYPGSAGSLPYGMTTSRGALYFFGGDPQSRNTLFRSDGTPAGTVAVHHFYDGNGSSSPSGLTDFNGTVLFAAMDVGTGAELWRSDGTAAGTTLVKDIYPGAAGSGPHSFVVTRGGAYFLAWNTAARSLGLFQTDGTADGTFPVADVYDDRTRITDAGDGGVYFNYADTLDYNNGTPFGTSFVNPLTGVSSSLAANNRGVLDGTLYFLSDLNGGGRELWKVARQVPAAPSGVAAASTSEGLRVTWNGASGEEAGFLIERSRDADFATIDGVGWAPAGAASFLDPAYRSDGPYYYRVRAYNAAGESAPSPATSPVAPPPGSTVAGRQVYYNGTLFDGGTRYETGADDDGAIDSGKSALLPGQIASAANVTGYMHGINGIMVDLAGLAGREPRLSDFVFRAGTGADVSAWRPVSTRDFLVGLRRGAGAGGSDRVTLLIPDDVIQNTWLQVTVLPTPNTGLAAPDVFYFGNLIGESGDRASSIRVNAIDLAAVKRVLDTTVPVTSAVDFNRDGWVNALDVAATRSALGRSLALFTAPGPAPASLRGAGAAPAAMPASLATDDRATRERWQDELWGTA